MSAKASNRAAFPQAARIVDELREVFGEGVKLEFAEEGGREIGQRDIPGTAVPASRMVLRAADDPAPEMNAKKGRR